MVSPYISCTRLWNWSEKEALSPTPRSSRDIELLLSDTSGEERHFLVSVESGSGDLCLFRSELDSVMLLTDSGSDGRGEQSDRLRSLREESCLRLEGTNGGRGSSPLLLVGSACARELLVAEVWEVSGVEVASGEVVRLTARSDLFCGSVSELTASENVSSLEAGAGRGAATGTAGASEGDEKEGEQL